MCSEHFIRAVGGDDNGALGCEAWIAREVVSASGRRARLSVRDVSILVSCPRCIFVRVRRAWFDMHIVVLHAPHRLHGVVAIDAFWAEASEAYRAAIGQARG
eukprot:6154485-Alexandrium_andersonii.AAC.1